MITRQMLEDAPVFTAFRGEAQCTLDDDQWALFNIDGGSTATDEVLDEAAKRGIRVSLCAQTGNFVEPEVDHDTVSPHTGLSDTDAALAFLNTGGAVAKLPDEMGSPYNRFYVIAHASTWFGDKDCDMATLQQKKDPEVEQRELINRLYEYFDDLKDFDVKTGERALFKECLEALQRVLPPRLASEPLVLGSYLLKMRANIDCAGLILAEAWQRGRY